MKILYVITRLQKAAGTSVFCGEVANGLAAMGHDVTIAVVNPGEQDLYPLDKRVKLISISSILTPNSYLLTPNSVIHIHGLWSPILHKVNAWARKNKTPVVWSTHGMTAPWSIRHKWWKKFIAWHLYQKRDLKNAAIIHSTTALEVEWNRKLGFKNPQIEVPLGTFIQKESAAELRNTGDALKVLFVGRVYPVKGLMNVVRAAVKLNDVNIKFRIVGPDQAGHLSELVAEAERLGVAAMFDWAGPKYGDELSREYDRCDILILPSFTENFGATVVDALSHSKPALASMFTPWKILEERECGWWVSNEPEKLAETFKKIAALSAEELESMGERGRKLVEEKYAWDAVCSAMIRGYESCLELGV
jgi:glycosyltransferase involved in cell wall biosynthesis